MIKAVGTIYFCCPPRRHSIVVRHTMLEQIIEDMLGQPAPLSSVGCRWLGRACPFVADRPSGFDTRVGDTRPEARSNEATTKPTSVYAAQARRDLEGMRPGNRG